MVILGIFQRRVSCFNWLRKNTPSALMDQLKSYAQFTRDLNRGRKWRITLVGASYYEISRFEVITRYDL
jgi:hypothetical protein